jgi:polar amino acid transport system substrate-binding protein
VVDLPTAFYITAAVLDDAVIAGQFQPTEGETEQFGLLLEKDNELVTCLDQALTSLDEDGTLARLEKRWLSQVTDVPELS